MPALKIAAKKVGTAGPACCCTIVGVLQCRTKGGTATLCGHDEFVPSSPPKKYRVRTSTGTIVQSVYGFGLCDVAPQCTVTTVWSATCTYNASTCATTTTGSAERTSTGGTCGSSTTDTGCGASDVDQPNGCTTTDTSTLRTTSCVGVCIEGSAPFYGYARSGSATSTLSTEDTEADAADRLLTSATWSAWTTVGVGDGQCAAPTCCKTIWSVRSSGFQFTYQEAEAKFSFAGMAPGWPYMMRVSLWQRAVGGSTWTFIGYLGDVHDSFGDGTYEVTESVPVERGFEYYVSEPVAIKQ